MFALTVISARRSRYHGSDIKYLVVAQALAVTHSEDAARAVVPLCVAARTQKQLLRPHRFIPALQHKCKLQRGHDSQIRSRSEVRRVFQGVVRSVPGKGRPPGRAEGGEEV